MWFATGVTIDHGFDVPHRPHRQHRLQLARPGHGSPSAATRPKRSSNASTHAAPTPLATPTNAPSSSTSKANSAWSTASPNSASASPAPTSFAPRALLAPELVLSQYDEEKYTLERCAIYDAGSRSFDIPRYIDDVEEYWTELRQLALDGLTLADALDERWPRAPFLERPRFDEVTTTMWRGVDATLLDQIFAAHHAWWAPDKVARMTTNDALVAICDQRLLELKQS